MAKIEDYISEEIDDAAEQQRERNEKGQYVPERFKGKTVEEVATSYEELEKLYSRQSNDLGMLRQQVDQLLNQQVQASSPQPEPSKPVSVDDLYEDADGNIRRIAKEETSSEIEALRKELQDMRLQSRLSQIDDKFPKWRDKVKDPEFMSWVQESPYRQRMIQDADQGDLDAAEEVLGMYYDSLKRKDKATADPAKLRDAMLESSSPVAADVADTFSRAELLDKRVQARKGSIAAENWLKANAEAIAQAYEEGRIVD